MSDFFELDGSYGEGGGQLVRTALALSALQSRPFRMVKVRAGRSSPGLKPQHLAAIRAMGRVCDAEITGDEIDATAFSFAPRAKPKAGDYTIDVSVLSERSSAGSASLIFQMLLLPLALDGERPSHLTFRGGTHVRWSPCYHYLTEVYLPLISRIGLSCRLELGSWGWYPQGEGEFHATVQPLTSRDELRGFELVRRGDMVEAWGISAASNLPQHIIERQRDQLAAQLRSRHIKPDIITIDAPSPGKGTVVFLLAQYENASAGFTGYGRLRYPAERVADDAFEEFDAYRRTDGALDPYLADQIMLPLCLAQGGSHYSTSRITEHLLSMAWLLRQFVDRKIEVQGEKGRPGRVLIY